TQAGGRKTEFYTEDGDVVKIIGKEGGLPTSTTTREYLAHRLTSETNNRGIKRTFEYNDWGWQIVSREAAGTADEIYVNTQWATVRKIPNSVETPSTLTTYTYYSETRPLVTKKTIKDKVSGIIRTWSYSYQFHSNGMISRIGVDGPRLDVSDIAYEYYDTSGRLIKEVNALGHTTEYLAFDALSRPNQIKYADDSIKTVVYDGRGRINKETVSNEKGTQVTLYEYDVEGNIIKTTDPSGKIWVKNYDRGYALESEGVGGNYEENALRTNYEYDKLGKLSVIEKGRIAAREGAEVGEEDCEIRDFEEINCYTFTEEDVYYFLRSYSKDFINDNLGHLIEDIYADGNKTLHYYDELSRLSKVTSPSGSNLISYQYDSLDRVKMKTDAVGRITTYTYDKDSNVVSIKDNANRFFDFSYNAFGEIKSLKMPHAGTTINTYDEASNLLTTTFQDGNFITNKYDAANRLIERKLSTGETHYFTYDRFTTEKGLLGKIADASGSTEYRYDNKFRKVSSVVYSIDGQNFSMSYTYDEAGNIASITYPSGYRITYDRNAITGEVTAIQGNNNNLLYNIKYKPLGDIETYQYGTNRTVELKYDRNYKITDINAGPMDLAFTYNSDQLVSQKTNNAYSAETQTFTYFKDQSLKEENGTNKKSQYTYDKIQNRLSETTISGNGLNGNYNYDSNEMLVGINGDGSIEYDARGNVIYDEHHGSRSERAYNALNQLTHVTLTSLNEPRNRPDYHSDCEPSEENCNNNTMILVLPLDIIYVVPIPLEGNATTSGSTSTETDVLEGDATRMLYNAHGHRTLKISPSGTYRFIYDQSGRLLAESLNGNLTKEYIYLGERLVAIKRGSTIDYVITDHTLRPEVVVNSSGSIVWRAFNHAFSREVVADSIDGLNIGFPGQYYDEEIDTWYNIRRDYDAITGRYLQSDPLGTVDGPNTYIYTGNNPVNRVDPTGEFWVVFSAAVTAIDLGVQLYKNGGDLSKVNWTEAAISAVGGGIIGKVATRAGKIVQKAYRANRTKGSPANNEIAQDKVTGGSCCFVAGTEVLTESGYKNIEDVALGEKLWAKDVETGEQDWKPVTHIFVEPDRGIYTINLIGNERFEQKIQATDDHPFYVIGKGWKTTIELVVGDNIETDGHGPMVVTSVIDEKRQDLTYNFTVADFHTYYVTQRNVLVHNCGDSVTKSANPKVKEVLDSIDANGFKVKINPKNPATKQEVNATIDFGDKTKVNLRVETHPLKQNGPDVRHANVEVTRQVKNKNRVTRNDHIVDE
ncbi:MAG: polymorphic toxin-type HINT domain-containing protein, partial [Pseudomonadota bacterium]